VACDHSEVIQASVGSFTSASLQCHRQEEATCRVCSLVNPFEESARPEYVTHACMPAGSVERVATSGTEYCS
jgi:hypothetical protein